MSGLLVALTPSLAGADYRTNLPTPVARISRDTLYLHNDFMIIVTALFVVVFGIMIYSMVKHRQSIGHHAAKFTGTSGPNSVDHITLFFIEGTVSISHVIFEVTVKSFPIYQIQ